MHDQETAYKILNSADHDLVSRPYLRLHPDHIILTSVKVFVLREVPSDETEILLTSANPYERALGEIFTKTGEDYDKAVVLVNELNQNYDLIKHYIDEIWVGRLNLTTSEQLLAALARFLYRPLYVTDEHVTRIYYHRDACSISFDKTLFMRNELSQLIYKPIPTPSEEEQEKRRQERIASYKREDYEIVDLKLYDLVEDFDGDMEEYNFHNYFKPEQFFENISSERSPFHNFQYWLRDHLKIDLQSDFTKYYITKQDYERLRKYYEWWFRAFYGEYLSEDAIESSVGFASLNNGPSHFFEEIPWAEEGKLYRRLR